MSISIPPKDYRKIKLNPAKEIELILIEKHYRKVNPKWVSSFKLDKFKSILTEEEINYLEDKYER
jgi:hypothetical protein